MRPISLWVRPLRTEGRVEFSVTDPNTHLHVRGSGPGPYVERILSEVEWTIQTALPKPAPGPTRRAASGTSTIPGQLTFESVT